MGCKVKILVLWREEGKYIKSVPTLEKKQGLRATADTQDWGPVTIALQALSLVEKAEPVQVRLTLRLRDQLSK